MSAADSGITLPEKLTVLFVLTLLVSGVGAYIYGAQQHPTSKSSLSMGNTETVKLAISSMIHNDVNLALNVTVTDPSGHRVANTYQPNDLIVNNFYNWLIAFLNNAQSSALVGPSGIKNTAGGSVTVYTWGTGSVGTCGSSPALLNCVSAGQGGLIEVGTSSTAATRADYNVGTAFQSYFTTNSVCAQNTVDSIVVTGSENANSSTTLTEAGLFLQGQGPTTIMLAHDVFGGVSVSASNTITVQYTWTLNNVGFNYNLCEYLAGLFTQPNGAGNLIKTPNALMVFYDTLGRNVTWAQASSTSQGASTTASLFPLASSSPTTSTTAAWNAGAANNAMKIAIGTGSSAFTPTSRALTTFYQSNYISTTSYDSAGNAYETATMSLATGATIGEAAIYLTLPQGCIGYSPLHSAGAGSCITGYGVDTIMLLASNFTPQVVPNLTGFGVTFQESG